MTDNDTTDRTTREPEPQTGGPAQDVAIVAAERVRRAREQSRSNQERGLER